jgi:uncharacterized protein
VRTESSSPDEAVVTAPAPGGSRRPSRPFLVQVAALRKVAGTTRHEARRGAIDGLGAVGVVVPDGSEIVADLTLSSYQGGIAADGTVTAPWTGECRRCGGPVSGTVTAVVREHYAPDGEGDEDAYPLEGDEIDLEPLARDAVLLDLPLAPLCSTDCRGLCPQCGANWNLSTCDCVANGDPRWSALDVLRDPGSD